MTKQRKTGAVTAGNFVDQLLSDILAAPDREILEDDEELEKSTGQSASEFVDKALRASLTALGKKRFAEASEGLRKEGGSPQISGVRMSAAAARQSYVRSVNEATSKLSVAARTGTHISETDVDSAMEDIAELEARKNRPKKK